MPEIYAHRIVRTLVIENDERPVLIKTEDGAYLLTDIKRAGKSVTFSYRKVRQGASTATGQGSRASEETRRSDLRRGWLPPW